MVRKGSTVRVRQRALWGIAFRGGGSGAHAGSAVRRGGRDGNFLETASPAEISSAGWHAWTWRTGWLPFPVSLTFVRSPEPDGIHSLAGDGPGRAVSRRRVPQRSGAGGPVRPATWRSFRPCRPAGRDSSCQSYEGRHRGKTRQPSWADLLRFTPQAALLPIAKISLPGEWCSGNAVIARCLDTLIALFPGLTA
jgi:hypothetical protein